MKKNYSTLLFTWLFTTAAISQVSLTGTVYTQDFVSLSNIAGSTTNTFSVPGWLITETGGGARDNEQYAADIGGSNTGDTYSYGNTASTDRALGFLRSGTLISTIGAAFTNNTGSAITALSISYTGEQWRLGTAARTDRLDFQYSVNATSLTTGTWIDADALDFITPTVVTIGAKDGNAAANRTAISASLSGLSIANGATFYIRWNDFDATGVDDGLAVDEFTLSTSLSTLPVSMISFSATRNNTGSTINWTTAQEVNSREFIVERAAGDGRTWQSIARIAAAGQSHAMLEYQVQDPHPLSGVNLYRLKSIDMDHNFSFSAICRVIFDSKYNYSLYPNPVINNLQVSAGDGRGFNGHIIICTLQGHAVLYKESRQSGAFINLDISLLKTGMYVLKIIADDGEINSLKFTKL